MDRGTSTTQATAARDPATDPGIDPQPCPDTATAPGPALKVAAELIRTILHFWPEWRQWLQAFPDPRLQPLITYERSFLVLWGLCLFLFKLRSRRQLDYELDACGTQ